MRHTCLIALVGCGRLGFEPLGDSQPLGAFGEATPLSISSSASDDDPTLTGDMLEIVFDSERGGGEGDLYSATRSSIEGLWSTPVRIDALSSTADEDGPSLSPDGLFITFSSNRNGGPGSNDLYASTRATRDSPWTTPVLIAELSSAFYEDRLSQTADRLHGTLYTTRTAGAEIYATRRTSSELPWESPTPLAVLESALEDITPALDASGTTIVFASNRAGGANYGIYVATRATPDAPFSAPTLIVELDSETGETDPWLSPDHRTIVFTRGPRDGTDRNIMMATR